MFYTFIFYYLALKLWMKLIEFIATLVDLPTEAEKEIFAAFKKEIFAKGDLILEKGKTCRKLYFVNKGLARSFYINENGKDITVWFFNSNSFLTAVESFFEQTPSYYNIQTLEETEVYSITHKKIHELFEKYHSMEKFGRILSIRMINLLAEKLNSIQFQTADDRYQFMLKTYPDIAIKAPLGHIASYLGITQETLSRIRAKH